MENKRKIRLFEIIDKMNVNDTNNGTQTLPVGLDLVSAQFKKGQGNVVTIGIGGGVSELMDIDSGKVRPMLVMLPMGLYDSMKFEEILDSHGIDQISSERLKQIDKHGYTGKNQAEHPEFYSEGQLLQASRELSYTNAPLSLRVPKNWDMEWFMRLAKKPFEDRIRIAGALLAAELDRLKYLMDNKTESDER